MKEVLLIILGILLAPFLLPGAVAGFLVYLLFQLWDADVLSMALGMTTGIVVTIFWIPFLISLF